MPLNNLSDKHFLASEKDQIFSLLKAIDAIIQPKAANLNPDERVSYSKVNETNKLIINKVKDYFELHPDLASPDVDWKEFGEDFEDRTFMEHVYKSMESTMQMIDNTRIAHDHDVYRASLTDYNYSTYKLRTNPAYEVKVKEIRQFFSRSGTGGKQDDKPEPPDPEV